VNLASPTTAPTPRGSRLWQLDAARGLMLVLMTLTHVPTRLTQPMGQPFGFVSAAFGFVFISGLLVGRVQGKRWHTLGAQAVRSALWRRAGVVYACHLGLLALLFAVLPLTGVVPERGPLPGMMWFYNSDPLPALLGAVSLIHQPGLLDILPMYVIFLLCSAPMLAWRARSGWHAPVALMLALWLLAQSGLPGQAYEQLALATGFPIPRAALGSFDLLAWQLVWFGGLMLGAAQAEGWRAKPTRWSRPLLAGAMLFAALCLALRHGTGMQVFPDGTIWAALFDKWHMGALRLLNALALGVVLVRFGPRSAQPGALWSPLQLLGRAALPVFVAHAIVAMLVLGIAGDEVGDRPVTVDVVILVLTFGTLFLTAWLAGRRRATRFMGSARSVASTA
jgi:hypothetical protein